MNIILRTLKRKIIKLLSLIIKLIIKLYKLINFTTMARNNYSYN